MSDAQTFTILLRADVPGQKPITIRAKSEIDGGIAGAFDRLMPGLVADLRERLTGEKQ